MRTSFLRQLSTYAAYHRDRRNRATHFVGVPTITFSLLAAAAFVPLGTVGSWPMTLATLLAAVVMVYWMSLDLPLGALASALHVPLVWLAHRAAGLEVATAWTIVVICFGGGWVLQLIGHVLEGRRPALVDNILQILIAPLFLVTEAATSLGLRSDVRDHLRSN